MEWISTQLISRCQAIDPWCGKLMFWIVGLFTLLVMFYAFSLWFMPKIDSQGSQVLNTISMRPILGKIALGISIFLGFVLILLVINYLV